MLGRPVLLGEQRAAIDMPIYRSQEIRSCSPALAQGLGHSGSLSPDKVLSASGPAWALRIGRFPAGLHTAASARQPDAGRDARSNPASIPARRAPELGEPGCIRGMASCTLP